MLGVRLREARRAAGLAQIELAVAMGDRYDNTMISHVETGRSGLVGDGLVSAARALGVSTDWLLGLTDDPTPAAELIERLAEQSLPAPANEDEYAEIDHLSEVAASAGVGAEVYDETVTGVVPFRRFWLRQRHIDPAHCHIIGVRGDSMEPTLPSGCSIIVDRNLWELRNGCIYVMRTEEGLVVKRVKQNAQGWWLMSDNPEWPPLALTEDTDIIGQVRWVARTLD